MDHINDPAFITAIVARIALSEHFPEAALDQSATKSFGAYLASMFSAIDIGGMVTDTD